jgi:hypothetical protein
LQIIQFITNATYYFVIDSLCELFWDLGWPGMDPIKLIRRIGITVLLFRPSWLLYAICKCDLLAFSHSFRGSGEHSMTYIICWIICLFRRSQLEGILMWILLLNSRALEKSCRLLDRLIDRPQFHGEASAWEWPSSRLLHNEAELMNHRRGRRGNGWAHDAVDNGFASGGTLEWQLRQRTEIDGGGGRSDGSGVKRWTVKLSSHLHQMDGSQPIEHSWGRQWGID